MKKYLLSLHGGFESAQICKDIATTITPIVDSAHLKFSHRESNLLFCFESEVDQSEIHAYIEGSLYGLYNYFILSIVDDNLLVCMEEDSKRHLFDVANDSEKVDMRIDMSKELKGESEIKSDEENQEYLNEIFNELKKRIKKPSLDEILDKIREKGISSITQFEKEILDNYGK